jgi:uncharacterized protein YcbK (DUF882 family)
MGLPHRPRLVLFLSALLLASVCAPRARAADGGAQPPRILAPGAKVAAPGAKVAAPGPKGSAPGPKGAAQVVKKGAKAPKAPKATKKPRTTTVVLYQLNRHDESFTLRQKDMQGRPPKGFQKRFDRFLRCHYTNKTHAMNLRLARLLYQTGRHWPGQRVEVVSGYRAPTVAKNPHSPHMKGLACDFRVAGVKNTELRDYLRGNMKKVGVGYYPNSSFVHLDVRKDRSAFWIDYSGPGERANYSQSPNEDLKTGRAETYRPTKIGDDWINDAPPDKSVPADDETEAKGATATAPGPASPGAGPAMAGRPAQPSSSATP